MAIQAEDLTDEQREAADRFYLWLTEDFGEMWEIEMQVDVGQYMRESGWITEAEDA